MQNGCSLTPTARTSLRGAADLVRIAQAELAEAAEVVESAAVGVRNPWPLSSVLSVESHEFRQALN
jgi:hypothetical protein